MKKVRRIGVSLSLFTLVCISGACGSAPTEGEIEIIRDTWGIPHVYADNEEALFYGAGYVTAEDRMLQMMLKRRMVQGRTAEILGPGPEDRFLNSDRRFRILGFHYKAEELLAALAPDTRRNLEAYAAGINAYIDEDRLLPLFDQYGGKPEPWTAADSIALWLRVGDRFSLGWQGEVPAKRELERLLAKNPNASLPTPLIDNSAEIVPEEEFARSNPEVYESFKNVVRKKSASRFHQAMPEIQLSHNWLVGGERSTTGMPILETDPHYSVNNPAFWHEIHLHGGRYNVRGVSIPGAPGLFLGWNDRIAWGATGFGGDTADLYEEKTDPENPNRYRWKDGWEEFVTRAETIVVKGQDPVVLEVRSTRHGPVVNELLQQVQPGEVFAMKNTILNAETSSLESILRLMRATDWASFRESFSTYVTPPLHMIYADVQGNIGYQSATQVPVRYEDEPLPKKGWRGEQEWEMLAFDNLPSMFNPKSNGIFTANHLPAGTWYPYRPSASRGEGPRAFRLREIFTEDLERKFSVQDFVEKVHQDCVNPVLRNFIIIARKIVEEDGASSPEIAECIKALEGWDETVSTNSGVYPLVSALAIKLEEIKFAGTTLESQYGTGWGGISHFVKKTLPPLRDSGKTPKDPQVRAWMKKILKEGYLARGTVSRVTETTGWLMEPSEQPAPAAESAPREAGTAHIRRMLYQDVPEGYGAERYGSLAPEYDMDSPPLCCPLTQSIWAHDGNSYSHIVDLGDLDNSLSMLPPGISEDPNNPHYDDQLIYWQDGTYHAAPLSREGVEKVKESSRVLSMNAANPH